MAGTKPVAWWGQERRLNEKTLGLDRQIHIKRERERERERLIFTYGFVSCKSCIDQLHITGSKRIPGDQFIENKKITGDHIQWQKRSCSLSEKRKACRENTHACMAV
jgi:hypothetical protein